MPFLVVVPVAMGIGWLFGTFSADTVKSLAWLVALAFAASLILGVL